MFKKKQFIIFIFLLLIVNLSTQVSFSDLKGKWIWSEGDLELIFQSEKLLYLGGEPANYSIVNSVIRIQDEEYYPMDYPFTLQGNVLNIIFPEGYELPFTRIGDSTQLDSQQYEQQLGEQQDFNYGQQQDQQYGQSQNNQYGQQQTQQYGQQYNQQQSSGQEHLLQGKLCCWSGSSTSSSSYSSTKWAYFDGQGNFQYGSESSFSSDAGNAWGNDGSGERGTYRISGDTVYLSYPDGSSDTATVHFRQDDGRITELKYGDDHYAKALCE